jgi:hypothetical protein
MESEQKLMAAEYHLKRMEELYGKNYEHFKFELEAFLTQARGVLDVLLYDFAEKFQLGVNRYKIELNDRIFEKKARERRNEQAIKFIEWWRQKRDELKDNFRPLLEKRNIAVHRGSVRPDIHKIHVYETITVMESVTVIKKDASGNIIEVYESPKEPIEKPTETKPTEIDWFFEEYPDKNIPNICREFLEKIRQFVEEAKMNFN